MIISELSIEDKMHFYENQLENISREPFKPWIVKIESDIVSVDFENRNDVIKRLQEVIGKLKVKGKIHGK